MKKRISDSEEEENAEHEVEFMGMCLFIPLSFLLPPFFFFFSFLTRFCTYIYLCYSFVTTTSPVTPITPVFAIFLAPVSTVPTTSVSVTPATPIPAVSTAPTFTSLGVFLSLIFFFTSSS